VLERGLAIAMFDLSGRPDPTQRRACGLIGAPVHLTLT